MQLKDARALEGFTQAELADAVGVHQKTIVNWEKTGVPPKSEYRVRRVLGKALQYCSDSANGYIDTDEEYPEWKTRMEYQDWVSIEQARIAEEQGGAHEPHEAQIEYDAEQARIGLEAAQAAHEEKLRRIGVLRPFTDSDLLHELIRRDEIRHSEAPDVSGMTDDELSNIDLSKGDYDLAATHDRSSVEEQSHPDYEDENQDPEV